MTTQLPAGDWLEPLASLETKTNSFIVTIRTSPRNATRMPDWHGSVEQAQSRERIYRRFRGMLARFLNSFGGRFLISVASRSDEGIRLARALQP
ncbi:MAG: hypothetical protein LC737_03450 [Chloroflexi bacterium]|nr:hypothetical protein [Chloroflexota bacterium]